MEDLPIKLELKPEYENGPTPVGLGGPEEDKYPTLHYQGPEDLDLPQTGEMTVRYRVKSETSKVNVQGKHFYRCDIEISEILKLKGDDEFTPPSKSGSSAGDALDRLKEEMEAKETDEDGDGDNDNAKY
jgi:hypothetical protein